MTTIAVKDGIMATDTLVSTGNRNYGHSRKLALSKDGWWASGAGEASTTELFFRWFETKRVSKINGVWTIPGVQTWKKASMLLLAPDATTYYFEGSLPVAIAGPFIADGSGAPFAIGAMEAGEGAIKAVLIAMKHDQSTGGCAEYVSAGFNSLGSIDPNG